jgi:hypothetical protein
MQIFLKTYNQRTITLEVEGSDTYDKVVAKINKELDKVDPLITENPRIIINGKELIPGGVCRDIGVLKESEGLIVEMMGYKNIRKKKEGWIQNLNTERFNLYNQLSQNAGKTGTIGMVGQPLPKRNFTDWSNMGGGRKRRKKNKTKRRRKTKKSKKSKKSRRTRRR